MVKVYDPVLDFNRSTSVKSILKPLKGLQQFNICKNDLSNGETPIEVTGVYDSARAQFIAGLSYSHINLIITYDEVRARQIVEDMKLYDRDTAFYPAKDLMFFSSDVHGQALTRERLIVINRLLEDEPQTIVTTIDSGLDAHLPYRYFERQKKIIKTGDILDIHEFSEELIGMGYERSGEVTFESCATTAVFHDNTQNADDKPESHFGGYIGVVDASGGANASVNNSLTVSFGTDGGTNACSVGGS